MAAAFAYGNVSIFPSRTAVALSIPYNVSDPACSSVDYEVFDFPEGLILYIDDFTAYHRLLRGGLYRPSCST